MDKGLDRDDLDDRIRQHLAEYARLDRGRVLASAALMPPPRIQTEPINGVERWIGRAAAIWVHPVGAWRVPSTRVRLVLVFGYAVTGYLLGLLSAFFLAVPSL